MYDASLVLFSHRRRTINRSLPMDTSIETPGNIDMIQQAVTIPVIEEHVVVDRKTIETGRVIISKKIEETNETIDIALLRENYSIEHLPVDKLVDEAPSIRYEGEVTIIPVIREVMVKRILIVEEIRIIKNTTETSEPQQMMLRKEVVTVERHDTQQ